MPDNVTELPSAKGTTKGDPEIQHAQLSGFRKVRQDRNRAYLLIALLIAIVIGQTVALIGLTPLKTVVPAIVTVDTATGRVVKTQSVTPEALASQEWIKQHEIYEYIIARNTADNTDKQRLVDYVALHSTEDVNTQFRNEITVQNPNSPYLLMGAHGRQTVKVMNISMLDKDMAQASFETTRQKSGQETTTEYWTATLKFQFTGKAKLELNDRWNNPLGFIVLSYRKDQQLGKPKAQSITDLL